MPADDKVRRLVVSLYETISHDWGFATDAIAAAFKRETNLGFRAKALIVENLRSLIAQKRRLEFALTGGGQTKDTPLALYIAWRVLSGNMSVEEARREIPRFNWDAVSKVDERMSAEADPVIRLGLSASIPDWLAQRLLGQYGSEAEALAQSFNDRPPQTIRVNALKTLREKLVAQLSKDEIAAQPTTLSKNGVTIDPPIEIFRSAAFREGLFEVQDEASQLVAELVEPSPGSLVIDACAGAGGKTLALGALMKNRGRLVALDVNARRLAELRERAKRAGLSNVRALEIPQLDTPLPPELSSFLGKADRVLVDAPCSGIGALRRNPEARWRLQEADLARLPEQQDAIARRAMEFVKPGGRLIYATCTVLREENEDVVERLCANSDFKLVPIKEILGKKLADKITDTSGRFMKLLPHRHGTDGFFAVVLKRSRNAGA